MGALRPGREVGYCFRIGEGANRIAVQRSGEDEKYVPAGFHRLKKGEIVPRRGKKGIREREVDGVEDEEEESNGAKGLKRKRVCAPPEDGAAEAESAKLKRRRGKERR